MIYVGIKWLIHSYQYGSFAAERAGCKKRLLFCLSKETPDVIYSEIILVCFVRNLLLARSAHHHHQVDGPYYKRIISSKQFIPLELQLRVGADMEPPSQTANQKGWVEPGNSALHWIRHIYTILYHFIYVILDFILWLHHSDIQQTEKFKHSIHKNTNWSRSLDLIKYLICSKSSSSIRSSFTRNCGTKGVAG